MKNMDYKKKKFIVIVIGDVLIITLLVIYFGLLRPHNFVKINGTYLNTPSAIADFQFIDNHGQPYTKKNLQGHWSMIFFGFTHCAMICPTTMATLNSMYKLLQQSLPEHALPQVILISVDPKRDTVATLNTFVKSFNQNFIGLRANTDAIIALEEQLHVAVAKDNLLNHSMDIVLINPKAQIQAYFQYPHHAAQLAADFTKIIAANTKASK